MGLFDVLFGRLRAPNGGRFQTLTAYSPTFTNWGGNIYQSERIRACIDAIARHVSKLRIETQGSAHPKLKTRLASAPNSFESWPQFLYRLTTIYYVYNTAFIVPILDQYGEIDGYFAVLPTSCEVLDVQGEAWLRYHFADGKTAAIEMSRCAVLKRHQCADDIFGEKNTALTETMQILDMQRQGTREGIKNSATFRFMAKLSNFAKPEDLAKERKRFNAENMQGESGGILLFPNTYSEIRQIESKPYLVDAEQIKIIDTRIYNYFGVNEEVLQNKAIGDALDGFYDGAIEPFAIQLADGLTGMTYTRRETAQGNRILVTANRLQYMSTANKISLAQQLGDRGILKVNEIRELFNYEPLEGEPGERIPTRGEYYDVNEGKEDE